MGEVATGTEGAVYRFLVVFWLVWEFMVHFYFCGFSVGDSVIYGFLQVPLWDVSIFVAVLLSMRGSGFICGCTGL